MHFKFTVLLMSGFMAIALFYHLNLRNNTVSNSFSETPRSNFPTSRAQRARGVLWESGAELWTFAIIRLGSADDLVSSAGTGQHCPVQ